MYANQRPGCYGYAITFTEESKACQVCAVSKSCGEESLEKRKKLLSLLEYRSDTRARSRRPNDCMKSESETMSSDEVEILIELEPESAEERAAPTPRKASTKRESSGSGLSKKAAEHLARIVENRGIDLRASILAGRNPIENRKPAFLAIVIDMILSRETFTRSDVVEVLKTELGWTDATAQSHASISQSLLTHTGVIAAENGIYKRVSA